MYLSDFSMGSKKCIPSGCHMCPLTECFVKHSPTFSAANRRTVFRLLQLAYKFAELLKFCDPTHTTVYGVVYAQDLSRGSVLFCSLAVHDPRVGHTVDELSPFIQTDRITALPRPYALSIGL